MSHIHAGIEVFILSIGHCSTINKFFTQYIFECICKIIWISNIFVSSNPAKYEYRIYSFLVTWPNTNIEYVRNQKIKYPYSNIKYSVLNIRIFEYICFTLWSLESHNMPTWKRRMTSKMDTTKKIKLTSNRKITSK